MIGLTFRSLSPGSSAHNINKNFTLEARRLLLISNLPPATLSLDRSYDLLPLLPGKWVELETCESPFGSDSLPSHESLLGSGALS